jgi:hypothetical protein
MSIIAPLLSATSTAGMVTDGLKDVVSDPFGTLTGTRLPMFQRVLSRMRETAEKKKQEGMGGYSVHAKDPSASFADRFPSWDASTFAERFGSERGPQAGLDWSSAFPFQNNNPDAASAAARVPMPQPRPQNGMQPTGNGNPFPTPLGQETGSNANPFPRPIGTPMGIPGQNPQVGNMADPSQLGGNLRARQVLDPATGTMMNDFYSKSFPPFFNPNIG